MQPTKEYRSINQIMGVLSDSTYSDSSYLVSRIAELCNKPIAEFEVEDFRMLINQNVGLKYLLPHALDILEGNILAEGDYFEGDLLKSILTVDKSFWEENVAMKERLKGICIKQIDAVKALDRSDPINESIYELVINFLEQ